MLVNGQVKTFSEHPLHARTILGIREMETGPQRAHCLAETSVIGCNKCDDSVQKMLGQGEGMREGCHTQVNGERKSVKRGLQRR